MPQQVMNTILKCCIVIMLISLFSGCGKPVTRADLSGTYVADYSVAKETLTLLPEGVFTQQVVIKTSSQILVTNGTWRFDMADQRITLGDGFYSVLDGFHKLKSPPEPTTADLPVVRLFGDVEIGDGQPTTYWKQTNP